MELLYIYIFNDERNIKGCGYNFSPNYRFTFNPETKTFHMETPNCLPNYWFGQNIVNITALVGKNGSGKTNLLDCIIKSVCGQGCGIIFFKYNGQIYTNLNARIDMYKFDFDLKRFNRFGSPLDSEFDEHIPDCSVAYYSSSIDRALSEKHSHYKKFKDLSNAYLLRNHKHDVGNPPQYGRMTDVDTMQTVDVLRLLLFFVYSKQAEHSSIGHIKLPGNIDIGLHAYSNITCTHPTYVALTSNLNDDFKDKLERYILDYIFTINKIPEQWNSDTSFNEVLSYLNRYESNRTNIYEVFSNLYNQGYIQYDSTSRQGLTGGHEKMSFKLNLSGVTQKALDAIFSYYNAWNRAPYAAYSTIDDSISNSLITFNYGVSSGERSFYTIISRIMGLIFQKQGEIHNTAEFKIINTHDYDGKTIILLLDEPDAQLHPEWQQQFTGLFIKFLEQYFPKVKFQIIFTTHSPVMLSDIPRSNTVFLKKKEDGSCMVIEPEGLKETFAANIHSLYNNSFFLEGIPIGDFAKRKINAIHESINNGYLSESTIKDIYRIGEPILRGALLRAYDEKRRTQSKEDRIRLLQKELRHLESGNNDQD